MQKEPIIRTRIAPSPTGNLHIGTARAALFNYLFSKHAGGVFVLRIEDTDVERSEKRFEKNIFKGLSWLGIVADESPESGGAFAPYRQSERIATYKKYLEKLLIEGKAFYCFHNKEQLEEEKKEQAAMKMPAKHFCGDWRDGTLEDAEKRKKTEASSIIRFKIPTTPSNHQVSFADIIRGKINFFTSLLGDFSIAKSLREPLYNFAVVIDDYDMGITHVIRGEDHIPNTPKQLLIAEALGWTKQNEISELEPPWKYAHLPLILGTDRSKLSKRHGATSVDEYMEDGYLPEALFNFITLLGWNPGGDRELFSEAELIELFSLENVQKSGAIFDVKKLDWMNGEYIRKKPISELVALSLPVLLRAGLLDSFDISKNREYLEKVIALEQP
ncbi:MAG: glutamate--tRNA ligase, partial [Candidatus Sungbacteria bacterium]|nr:glutamate--tRNA ligase [Candidatus Sungbacteria bacterium]